MLSQNSQDKPQEHPGQHADICVAENNNSAAFSHSPFEFFIAHNY